MLDERGRFKPFLRSSVREDGNMSMRYFPNCAPMTEEEALANRRRFFQKHGIERDFQIRGSENCDVIGGISPDAAVDAVITRVPNVFIWMLFGDCVPVHLYDLKGGVYAMIHGGWKNADVNLHLKALNAMTGDFGCDPGDIVAFLGPAIRSGSYAHDVPPRQTGDPRWNGFIEKGGDGMYRIDLPGYFASGLAGRVSQIYRSPIDVGSATGLGARYPSNHVGKTDQSKRGRFISGGMMAVDAR